MTAKEKQLKLITMKKIFIAMLALAAASCAKNETVELNREVIGFGDAFVENSTRAIYERAEDITGFTVFGNVANVALYGGTGATVTRDGKALEEAWTCSIPRYWIPNATFNFAAIANGTAANVENGLPTAISYTVNSEDPADLIYATATAKTDENSAPISGVNNNKVVAFSFQHLLSRVKVSFLNKISETVYTYNIKDVKITTWQKGVYTPANDAPWAQDGTVTADLAYSALSSLAYSTIATSAGAQLVIPGSTVDLSFNYELLLKDTKIYETTTPVVKSAVVKPVQNYSYNIIVELQAGNKIDFSVSETTGLTGWTEQANQTIQ